VNVTLAQLALAGAKELLAEADAQEADDQRRRELRERLTQRLRHGDALDPDALREGSRNRLDPSLSDLALLDTSVWARLRDGRISGRAAEGLYRQIDQGELALTEPLLLLEMRSSARDGTDFRLLAEELDAMPLVPLETTAVRRSLAAQAQLAALPDVSHRVKTIDLLVAAVAEHHGAVVIHYDADYQLLAERTDLAFTSVWAAERGSAG
jgi:predicted nucleic acid-binding protein